MNNSSDSLKLLTRGYDCATETLCVSCLMQVEANGGELVLPAEPNKFAAPHPIRDWARDDDCDMFFANNFVAVARRRQ